MICTYIFLFHRIPLTCRNSILQVCTYQIVNSDLRQRIRKSVTMAFRNRKKFEAFVYFGLGIKLSLKILDRSMNQ